MERDRGHREKREPPRTLKGKARQYTWRSATYCKVAMNIMVWNLEQRLRYIESRFTCLSTLACWYRGPWWLVGSRVCYMFHLYRGMTPTSVLRRPGPGTLFVVLSCAARRGAARGSRNRSRFRRSGDGVTHSKPGRLEQASFFRALRWPRWDGSRCWSGSHQNIY